MPHRPPAPRERPAQAHSDSEMKMLHYWRDGIAMVWTLDWVARQKSTIAPIDQPTSGRTAAAVYGRESLSPDAYRAFNLLQLEWHHIIRYVVLLLALQYVR